MWTNHTIRVCWLNSICFQRSRIIYFILVMTYRLLVVIFFTPLILFVSETSYNCILTNGSKNISLYNFRCIPIDKNTFQRGILRYLYVHWKMLSFLLVDINWSASPHIFPSPTLLFVKRNYSCSQLNRNLHDSGIWLYEKMKRILCSYSIYNIKILHIYLVDKIVSFKLSRDRVVNTCVVISILLIQRQQ